MSGKSTAAKRRGRAPKKGTLALTTQQLRAHNLRQKEKEDKEANDEAAAAVAAASAAVGAPGEASAAAAAVDACVRHPNLP